MIYDSNEQKGRMMVMSSLQLSSAMPRLAFSSSSTDTTRLPTFICMRMLLATQVRICLGAPNCRRLLWSIDAQNEGVSDSTVCESSGCGALFPRVSVINSAPSLVEMVICLASDMRVRKRFKTPLRSSFSPSAAIVPVCRSLFFSSCRNARNAHTKGLRNDGSPPCEISNLLCPQSALRDHKDPRSVSVRRQVLPHMN